MLDLIEPFLTAEGIQYARCMSIYFRFPRRRSRLRWRNVDDGSMTKDKREASLEKIRSSKSTRCILISFKAGSTGTSSPTHGERQFPTSVCSRFEPDLL